MVSRFRLWWPSIRKYWVVTIIIALVAMSATIFLGYWFKWDWTGFNGHVGPNVQQYQPAKTLWDWLNLLGVLAIPAVVGLGAAWYTAQQGKVSDRENTNNQRETALQAYIDKMSELLLHEKLRNSAEEDEVRKIARVRTLTILPRLDADRKRSVLQFLYESGLIDKDEHIIDLQGAYLSGANLRGTDLQGAELGGSNLREADLREANLEQADLRGADLHKANMGLLYSSLTMHGYSDPRGTRLNKAVLSGADLSEADLRSANLSEASMYSTKLDKADLSQAILRSANLERAELVETNLTGAFLDYANLNGANLSRANLRGAILWGATLTGSNGWVDESAEYVPERERLSRGADLSEADLSGADLKDAIVTLEQLKEAKSLKGTIMPDGLKHP